MNEPGDITTTRTGYDGVAGLYADLVAGHLERNPFERAMLGIFAELVRENGSGPVADIGCGPGRLTAHLRELGLDVFGTDLSPEMIALAEQSYPGLRFEVGTMERLGIPDGSLSGLLAWYSIIHLPPRRVPEVLAGFHRVLTDGGYALLAFQATDPPASITAFDHKVAAAYRWSPEHLLELLVAAGFAPVTRMVRAPQPDERFDQACVLVRKDPGVAA
ncbi:class I SAM-dependent methyltransferase [Nocardia cyriacigeorgica]|uniref:class I SAM-dependent DNA methyltransferase n=1 Tax=Nocardia cyriacigeorgica TaxID=135487 RepID=UPI0002D26A51|nr:class I SAM-dependent methyltransferase [Nocardia cyriacigeorgica]AVH21572.1 class I SAM-dependent methyltransferase [Nocardia cyriacigeorgica]MBF6085965.1 class I SAM-dependent methyltransferase [Nocardia cyriacigeorgica]MBF6092055.1 class I SAM-dependent methyltransferase [Nocardia cyriacigeorgica]MBF6394298.1 class I SAM-dependent methyltransferase [Nocardia cyriacigeorgica]MBF6399933.1 class I SAM-dependent methyltransferase [Nocardia cyriacigeorgica]